MGIKGTVIPKSVSLTYDEQIALSSIINELTETYSFIEKIILYGSKARGDFLEDSDIDLLFIVEGTLSLSTKFQISDIIYKYELSHDVVVSAIFVNDADFRNKINTFLMRVRKEGIVLWSRE